MPRGATPGPGYNVAQRLSQIFHPVPMGLVSILIMGLFALPDRRTGLAWAALSAALQIIPPTVFFSIRLRQGAYSDEDISVRQQRNELYFFGFVTVIIGLIVLLLLDAPPPFLALQWSVLLLNVISWFINIFWKISLHAAGIGSCAALAGIYSRPLGLLLWGCALALGWARVRTRNHTPMQVVAGLALAAACVTAAFRWFGIM